MIAGRLSEAFPDQQITTRQSDYGFGEVVQFTVRTDDVTYSSYEVSVRQLRTDDAAVHLADKIIAFLRKQMADDDPTQP